MSGHSKWSTIKRAKGKSDAIKGRIFTKIGREIAVAVKMGGADPTLNSRLRDAINKAKAANMPNDNITRSIKKASGELGQINYETVIYEGYGIAGSAVIVEALTDNKNRTAGEVRHKFDKYGGSMGTTGCVSYMFETKGVIAIAADGLDEEEVMMTAIDCGAEDFVREGDTFVIYTSMSDLSTVRDSLESAGLSIMEAEVDRIPLNTIVLDGDNLTKFLTMIEKLEDDDDVQTIYHNVDLPEDPEEE